MQTPRRGCCTGRGRPGGRAVGDYIIMGSNIVGKVIKRDSDFSQFLKVVKRRGKPAHLPFYEHIASEGFALAELPDCA